jgi:hypothetical protein
VEKILAMLPVNLPVLTIQADESFQTIYVTAQVNTGNVNDEDGTPIVVRSTVNTPFSHTFSYTFSHTFSYTFSYTFSHRSHTRSHTVLTHVLTHVPTPVPTHVLTRSLPAPTPSSRRARSSPPHARSIRSTRARSCDVKKYFAHAVPSPQASSRAQSKRDAASIPFLCATATASARAEQSPRRSAAHSTHAVAPHPPGALRRRR